MHKNSCFLKSLKFATSGIITAFRTERNLRFHFMIANLILVFAYFYGISRVEWGILFFSIALVFVAELLNSAIENAVDTATKDYVLTAKIAKDVAAGAALVSAIFAVVIGFVLFGDWNRITYTCTRIFTNMEYLIPCLLLGIFDLILLFFGGVKKNNDNKCL